MQSLHSLLFEGQSGDLQDNLHLFWRWQKQMQNARGQARKQIAEPQLGFHPASAKKCQPTILMMMGGQ